MITQAVSKADLLAAFHKEGGPDRPFMKQQADPTRKTELSSRAEPAGLLHRADGGRVALDRAVGTVEHMLKSADLQVRLLVDEETEQVVVKVVKESGEVIRQFPPEEILELARYLSEEQMNRPDKGVLDKGVLLEERA
ncbi:MAG: flagellar protein FlaG [Nitrospira sp.]|nr:flagellar protein FlaG [Nitrospira sp.]MCP9442248.1 flagellar protein FlaG [Nitrospira sp.]